MSPTSLFRYPGTKLLALTLAAGYWLLVSAPRRESLQERTYDVPIAFTGKPNDWYITNPVQRTVSVRLRGRLSMMRSLSSQGLEAVVDLKGITKEGDVIASISAQAINVPPEIEVIAIDPAQITVRLEARRQKLVPIEGRLVGAPPGGFVVGAVTIVPNQALASGPTSVIRGLTALGTDRIILSSRTATFQMPVGLVADHPMVSVVEPRMAQVLVTIVPAPAPEEEKPETSKGPSAKSTKKARK